MLFRSRFQGKGPILRLENSQLSRRGSALRMEGVLDVRRLGQQDFFKNVKMTPVPGMERSLEVGGLAIGPGSQEGENDGFKLQTSISPEQSVKFKLEKEEKIIAVEHRKKF